MTYSVSGNVVSVTAPSSEWVAQNGAATGSFPVQVTVGGSRSDFVSDNRPADYCSNSDNWSLQQRVPSDLQVSGNVVSVTAPSSEWVAQNGVATGSFPVQVTVGGSRSDFVSDNRTAITEPTLIVGLYSNEYPSDLQC